MKFNTYKTGVIADNVPCFDLRQTLDCGQSFRWSENPDGSFCGVAYGKQVTVSFRDSSFVIDGASPEDFENIWKNYFDLETDYEQIRNEIRGIHPVLDEASRYCSGIRILRQEPFEALCSFIISQNNNIGRIKGIIDRMCTSFGEPAQGGGYKFVTAEKLAGMSVDDLSVLRAGFRARYLIDAAQKVVNGEVDLEKCRTADYDDARRELMKIIGVGTKVADCTLLFGMHRIEAFPIDVWMKRAMEKLFPTMTAKDFGKYAGIAQQYIFHYSRMNPDLFKD